MTKRPGRAVAVMAATVVFVAFADGARADSAERHGGLVDGGAESDDVRGWQGHGFEPTPYGSTATVPSRLFAAWDWRWPPVLPLGRRLFVLSAGSEMRQMADLQAFAGEIDTGKQWFTVQAWLGGSGGSDYGVVMSLTFLDAARRPLGLSQPAGPQTDGDRLGESTLLACHIASLAPPLARYGVVELRASGTSNSGEALADSISMLPGIHPQVDRPYGPRVRQSPGCARPGPVVPPTISIGRLSAQAIAVRASSRARLAVRIEKKSRTSGWRPARVLSRLTHTATEVRFALRPRLSPGRYRVVVRARKPGTRGPTVRTARRTIQ